jgi:hypothetical protein
MIILLLFLFSFLILVLLHSLYDTCSLFLHSDYEKTINLILEEKIKNCLEANPDNISFSTEERSVNSDERSINSNNRFSCINVDCSNLRNNISKLFNGLKIETKFTIHKLKVFDKTLS